MTSKSVALIEILIVLVSILIVYNVFVKPSGFDPPLEYGLAEMNAEPAEIISRAPETMPGPMVSYAPFLVVLTDERFCKITMALELSKDSDFLVEVTTKEHKIKDVILQILSAKNSEEIDTTIGKIALNQEIMRKLNTMMTGGRIVDIYITEFILQ